MSDVSEKETSVCHQSLPWIFALDQVNYARWLPTFLVDLKLLPENKSLLPENKSLFQEFYKGNFTVKQSDRVFSNMGFDQVYEQSKKIVKADGGSIGILEIKLLWSSGQSVDLRFLTCFRKYSATIKEIT